MKNILFVLLLLLTVLVQAQQTTAIAEVAQVEDQMLIEEKSHKETKLRQIERELEAVKKENLRLKMLVDKHRQCIKGDHTNHSEIVGLDEDKARRRTVKRKSNQNNLPPPL